MKRETLEEFIDRVAYKSDSFGLSVYLNKFDDSYLCLADDSVKMKRLFDAGVTEELQSCFGPKDSTNLGFNPEEQKWYGWSHRGFYGFGVGAKCKKGMVHYHPCNKEDFVTYMIDFWSDEYHDSVWAREEMNGEKLGVKIFWEHTNKVPNEFLRGKTGSVFAPYPKIWGKGEWTAKTLEDAKQMAIDFVLGIK